MSSNKDTTPKELKLGPNGRPSPEQIAAWKQEHKAVFQVEHDGKIAIMRKPNMLDLERAMVRAKAPGAKPLDFNRNIVGTCKLFIEEGARNNDEFELALLSAVGEWATLPEAEVKKL